MPVRLGNDLEPIPGYKLIERLGRGGFGEVWKAEAPGGLMKAIKFVYGEIGGKGAGADQELRALNRVKTVRHPFILSLERVDVIEGQLIIVMELADRNLLDRFRECQALNLPGIPREELLRYLEEAAEALDLMNTEYQLQHLDIKPQNLFLVRNHIKVADFGLVKDLEGMKADITGGVTPLYAAPETFEGWVSRYCDEYSLAIVYQELLTGQRPFDGTNARQLLRQHVEQEPDVSSLPLADQAIIKRALAKKPADRYPSCGYMVRMLRGGDTPEDIVRTPDVATSPQPGRVATTPSPSTGKPQLTPVTSPLPGDDGPGSGILWEVQEEADQTHNLAPQKGSQPRLSITPRPGLSTNTQPPEAPASQTNRVGVQPSAPVEFKGAGVLYPALVIGLGQMGLQVIQQLRLALHDQFGSMDELPHIRMLYIDTDPDAMTQAARANKGAALSAREMVLARLNRVSHFIKPRDGQVPYSTWLETELIYRIPRNQLTGNQRFLGRLAFIDNYRDIADRLRTDLGAITESDAIAAADRKTKLGLRSNKPRVYIVTSLGGGTGSGSFIDVAYLTRYFLKQLGYAQPDTVGLFFLPPLERHPLRPLAVGNTVAALTEINHYSTPGVTFSAKYALKEPVLTDSEPPFNRCMVLPNGEDEKGLKEVSGLAAAYLYREMISPLGRAVETRRGGVAPPPTMQTFGMFRLTWPRRPLVHQIARRICLKLVQHWVKKDADDVKDAVATWAQEQWTRRQLEADRLIACLKAATEGALDAVPEKVFDALAMKFAKEVPQGGNPEPAQANATLEEIIKLVGKPEGDKPLPKTPVLVEELERAAQTLLLTCEQKLAEMAVHLVEQPKYRLAGAEESIRAFGRILESAIGAQEPLCDEFVSKSAAAFARIASILETLQTMQSQQNRRKVIVTGDLIDLFRIYSTYRLRALVMQRVLTILRSLRGNCPEYLREFTYCRARLLDLVKIFETPVAANVAQNLGPSRDLFPAGCNTIDQAVDQFMKALTAEELIDLDQRVQALLRRQFTALVHVCTAKDNMLRDLEAAMVAELEGFVTGRLGASNAIETFLSQYDQIPRAKQEIKAAYDDALPPLPLDPGPTRNGFGLVIVPSEANADEFNHAVRQTLATVDLVPGPKGDDIVFFREMPNVTLADLPHLGADGRAAYKELTDPEHFTPHSRTDVTDWRIPGERGG